MLKSSVASLGFVWSWPHHCWVTISPWCPVSVPRCPPLHLCLRRWFPRHVCSWDSGHPSDEIFALNQHLLVCQLKLLALLILCSSCADSLVHSTASKPQLFPHSAKNIKPKKKKKKKVQRHKLGFTIMCSLNSAMKPVHGNHLNCFRGR